MQTQREMACELFASFTRHELKLAKLGHFQEIESERGECWSGTVKYWIEVFSTKRVKSRKEKKMYLLSETIPIPSNLKGGVKYNRNSFADTTRAAAISVRRGDYDKLGVYATAYGWSICQVSKLAKFQPYYIVYADRLEVYEERNEFLPA